MRLTTVILIATLMQVSAANMAQQVTYVKSDVTLRTIFKEITKQTGYEVLYANKNLDDQKKIDVNFKNTPLTEVLDKCLSAQNVTYTIDENKGILIKAKEPSFLDKVIDRITAIDVRGRVVDENGKPLEGATVVLKGTSRTVKTDVRGEFVIANVPDDGVLVIRYVGYKQLEINLKDAVMPLEIKLNVATGELEEVNVTYSTGYQNIPKERATGSFVQIDKELFNRAVGTNVLDRILEVTNSLKTIPLSLSGGGISTDVTIRGFSTINANMKPLIVVDGFPYEESGNEFREISLKNLNPNDVESITILRDAAAASIWGARSGNGVIVITTKKGRYNQKTNIGFTSSVNLSEKPKLDKMNVIQPLDAIEFEKRMFATGVYNQYDDIYPSFDDFPMQSPAIEVMLAARKANLSVPGYNVLKDSEVLAKLAEMGSHDVRDDISKYLLQTGVNQQYAFNISGGTDKMNYYSSVGYDRNIPLDKGNDNNRLTLTFRSSYRPIKKLELNAYVVYTKSRSVNNGVGSASYLPGSTSIVAPYTSLADDNGNPLHVSTRGRGYRTPYIDTASYPALLDWHYKPLEEIKNNDNTSNLYSTRFGGGIKYDLISGLSLNLNSQYEKSLSNINNYKNLKNYETRDLINQFMQRSVNGTIVYPVPREGILDYVNAEQTSWNIRGQLDFNRTLNKHQINALMGAEARETIYGFNNGRIYGYDSNTNTLSANMDYKSAYPTRASGGNALPIPAGIAVGGKQDRFVSYFANAGYTYDNKYTLTASGRVDASNFFGSNANQRFAPLWSSGIAWEISNENFYRLRLLSKLKFRATYGYNANMNNKATALPTAQYNSPSGIYHSEIKVTLLGAPNPGLTWEKIKNINLGLDYTFSHQRVSGSFDYYIKKGINLIGLKLLEPTLGISSYTGNYANMTSKGFDLMINSVNTNGSVRWSTNFNLSYNVDKITNYEMTASSLTSTSYYFGNAAPVLGQPRLKIYSYPSAGLDPVNGNPRGYVNGEVVNFSQVLLTPSSGGAKPSDLFYHGSATPQLFGNMINQFDYKHFSFSFNISYALKYYVRKVSVDYSNLFNNWGNAHGDYYLRWNKPGDENITSIPSVPNTTTDNRYAFFSKSNVLVVKGDHIRLNDLRLSYDLNQKILKRSPFSSANIYIYSSNLGIIL